MDVHCSTCNEPWDTYHLWQDAIEETGLSEQEVRDWHALHHSERLANKYRTAFRALGWEFGRSVINVTRCPACPAGAMPVPNRVATKAALEKLFEDDQDALASLYENYRL